MTQYNSNQNDYVRPEDASIYYSVPGVNPGFKNKLYSFRYCDIPLMGCGPAGTPIIDCDEYWDNSLLDGLEEEFNNSIGQARHRLHYMTPFGLIPQHINNQKCLDSYLLNLNKYDPNYDYAPYIQDINHYHELKNYMLARFNLNRPWKNVIHLKKLKSFFEKNDSAEWNDVAHLFPKLMKLVENLPFKTIGYVMIMRNQEDSKLDIHRDIYPRNHCCHHINISIDRRPRPVFMYDSHTNTKYYRKQNSLSYFFNEFDLHGSDPTFEEGLTLRVDGVFKDEFAKSIGLSNGITFDWAYDKPQEFYKQNDEKINIIDSTDI